MSFNNSAFRKLLKKYRGWTEGEILRFPSPYLKDQFLNRNDELVVKLLDNEF